MKLTGSKIYEARPDQIWSLLMDMDSLIRITPGLSRLEMKEEDHFDAYIDVKIGPVKGSFKGEMAIENKKEDNSFTLLIMQKSKIGNVNASVDIQMEAVDTSHTELTFNGLAKLSGLVARTGNRVLSGVANSMSKQFFDNLDSELNKMKSNDA